MRRFAAMFCFVSGLAMPAWANDIALIIGNENYDAVSGHRGATDVLNGQRALRDAGFDVVARDNARGLDQVRALEDFLDRIGPETQRIVVALAGSFAHSSTDAYLLPIDTRLPVRLDAALREGMPLSVLLAVLADYPGHAVLMLAEGREGGVLGMQLDYGLGDIQIPQGVTVLRGAPEALAAAMETVLVDSAPDTLTMAQGQFGLVASGFLPQEFPFVRAGVTETTAAGPSEGDVWTAAQLADDLAGYERYLVLFPNGEHAERAQAMIDEIRNEPNRAARKGEEALGLSRDARREIQRDLSILDYNTRGIDGIFGRGTRAAITEWQKESGFEQTGYLTGNQIARLDQQATERAAQLEEEAKRRAEEQEARDRAYWTQTGAAGDEAGLRAYLKEYPDGVFAELAQERLDAILDRQRRRAEARETRAWEEAEQSNSADGYRAFLDDFPDGIFASEANARLQAMDRDRAEAQAQAQAKAREDALGMDGTMRRLVEARLSAMGLKPGKVDGTFTDTTRRAIRRYQDARRLNVTGYIDQDTAVRLLADSLLR